MSSSRVATRVFWSMFKRILSPEQSAVVSSNVLRNVNIHSGATQLVNDDRLNCWGFVVRVPGFFCSATNTVTVTAGIAFITTPKLYHDCSVWLYAFSHFQVTICLYKFTSEWQLCNVVTSISLIRTFSWFSGEKHSFFLPLVIVSVLKLGGWQILQVFLFYLSGYSGACGTLFKSSISRADQQFFCYFVPHTMNSLFWWTRLRHDMLTKRSNWKWQLAIRFEHWNRFENSTQIIQ